MARNLLLFTLLWVQTLWGESIFAPSLILPEAKDALISDLYLSSSGLLAVGERGHFFTIDLNTFKPTQHSLPIKQFLTTLAETPKGTILVAGHDAVILRKGVDEKWLLAYENRDREAPIFSMIFNEQGIGVAVGAYGLVLVSQDDGKTWKEQDLEIDEPHLYQVKLKGSEFYAVGEWGTLIKLGSDGKFIEKLETGIETTLFGIDWIPKGGILCYGLRGLVIQTDAFENPFEKVENDSVASLFNSYAYKQGLLICGSAGTLLFYEGGILTPLNFPERVDLTDLLPLQDSILLGTTQGFRKKADLER